MDNGLIINLDMTIGSVETGSANTKLELRFFNRTRRILYGFGLPETWKIFISYEIMYFLLWNFMRSILRGESRSRGERKGVSIKIRRHHVWYLCEGWLWKISACYLVYSLRNISFKEDNKPLTVHAIYSKFVDMSERKIIVWRTKNI